MNIVNLIILIVALIAVLGILIFLYIYKPSKKRALHVKEEKQKLKEKPVPSFKKLLDIIKNNATTDKELLSAAELILKHYGTIKAKHGVAPDKDFKRYAEAIFAISRHPNTNKDIVIMFDRELSKRNPSYQREIDEMFNRGLSARG
jgi:hypothetical protein